ncbi:hypothetical protein DYB32_000807, partial [Aphanomyces invadans]
ICYTKESIFVFLRSTGTTAAASTMDNQKSAPTMELEHAIGFSGISAGLHYHPNGQDYVYPAGGCIVIASLSDPHNQVFLRGHDANITCLTMSPTGRYLASGQAGSNADILVWDYASRQLLFRLSEHDFGINAVAFSHDEKLLVSVGNERDARIFLWDMANGNIVTTQQKLQATVLAVCWGGFHRDIKRRDTTSYLFATGGTRMLQFWVLNPITGELVANKVEFGAPVVRDYTCVQFTPDRETMVAGTTSGDFAVVHVKTRRFLQSISACTCGVLSLCAWNEGVLVGGGDGSLLFFNNDFVDSAKQSLVGAISGLSPLAGSGSVMAGTQSGFIYHVTVHPSQPSMASRLICENHSNGVLAIAFAPQHSDRFATISKDCTIRIWDGSDYSVVRDMVSHLKEHSMAITGLALFDDDVHLLSCSRDKSFLCWELRTERRIAAHIQRMGGLNAIALSRNQSIVLTVGQEKRISYWDLRIEAPVNVITKAHADEATCLAVAHTMPYFATGGTDQLIKLWSFDTGRCFFPSQSCLLIMDGVGHSGSVRSLEFSPDDRQLVSVGDEGSIFVWNLYSE